jgi:RNAse (barnase) inhibitor barstar
MFAVDPLRISSLGTILWPMFKEYVLDGSRITSLEAFYDQVSERLIPGANWGRNLDAFNDILRGGFGTPEEGFVLRWTDSEVSRASLSHVETVRQLEKRLEHSDPSNREGVRADLIQAQKGQGTTVFDWLVEIIQTHGTGGDEAEDNVSLVLE